MKENMQGMTRPHLILFAISAIVALVARLGLLIMDSSGTLAYDYISATNVPILDVVCSILTGSAFVAFMFAAALALGVSAAGVALQGLLFSRRAIKSGKPGRSFLWGWATAAVSLICLLIVVSGILSPIQIASMSSKLPSALILLGAFVVFAAFLGTLLSAASMVVCACLARARTEKRAGLNLIIATAVCGLVVMILTINTFAAINVASIDAGSVIMWFAIDLVVNVVILVAAYVVVRSVHARQ